MCKTLRFPYIMRAIIVMNTLLVVYVPHISSQDLAIVTSDFTVAPSTTPANLNTSSEFDEYWVRTVLEIKSPLINVTSPSFVQDMEENLASLLYRGILREQTLTSGNYMAYKRRKKRFATFRDVTVQMTNTRRGQAQNDKFSEVDLVYYMVEGEINGLIPNFTDAERVVFLMSLFDVQEVAIALGHPVIKKAEIYDPPPPDPEPLYWVIGVVLGGLLFIAGLIWCILFIYFKCTRPPANAKTSPRGSVRGGSIRGSPSPRRRHFSNVSDRSIPSLAEYQKSHAPKVEYKYKANGKQNGIHDSDFSDYNDASPMVNGASVQKSKSKKTPVIAPVIKQSASDQLSTAPPPSHDPVYAVVDKSKKRKKKKNRKLEDITESDTQVSESERCTENGSKVSASHTLTSSKQTPGVHSSRKHRKDFDSDERLEKQMRPVSKTVHQIHLPPLQPQPLVASIPTATTEDNEGETMRQKAKVERQKNKQRQRRERKIARQAKEREHEHINAEPKREKTLKSKKKKHKKRSYDVEGAKPQVDVEMDDMFGPISGPNTHYNNIQPYIHRPDEQFGKTAELESDSSANAAEEEPLEESRERMHALLDDAFALGKLQSSVDEMPKYKQGKDEAKAAKHTPMQLTTAKASPRVHQAWSPYAAADVASQLPHESPNYEQTQPGYVSNGGVHWSAKRPQITQQGNSNSAYIPDSPKSDRSGFPAKSRAEFESDNRTPAEIRAALQPADYTSVTMDARVFAPASLRNQDTHDSNERSLGRTGNEELQLSRRDTFTMNMASLGASDDNISTSMTGYDLRGSHNSFSQHPPQTNAQLQSSPYAWIPRNIHDSIPADQMTSTTSNGHLHKQPRTADESELDIVNTAMTPGMSSAPLVASIREELQRLSAAPKNDSILSFQQP